MHRLREFDIVAVSLPEAGPLHNTAFNSHVLAIAGTTIALEPVSRPQVTWLPENGQDAFLTFQHGGSLIALKGLAHHARLRRRPALQGHRPHALRPAQGHARERVPAGLAALDRLGHALRGPDRRHQRGRPAHRVRGAHERGSPVDVTLSLPGADEPVQGAAIVVRIEEGRIAAQLTSATPEARSRIARFVLERNRARLRLRQQMTEAEDIDF